MARDLGDLAVRQLAAWEHVVREWPVQIGMRENGSFHLICAVCDMAVIPVIGGVGVRDMGTSYTLTHNITLAALVAHVRNVHRDIESEVYRTDGRQDPKATDYPRASSADSGGTSNPYRL